MLSLAFVIVNICAYDKKKIWQFTCVYIDNNYNLMNDFFGRFAARSYASYSVSNGVSNEENLYVFLFLVSSL